MHNFNFPICSRVSSSNTSEHHYDPSHFSKIQQTAEKVPIGLGYGPILQSTVKYNTRYPNMKCGAPVQINFSIADKSLERTELYASFKSKRDWEIARWAKLRGVGSTSFSELLAIDGVHFLG